MLFTPRAVAPRPTKWFGGCEGFPKRNKLSLKAWRRSTVALLPPETAQPMFNWIFQRGGFILKNLNRNWKCENNPYVDFQALYVFFFLSFFNVISWVWVLHSYTNSYFLSTLNATEPTFFLQNSCSIPHIVILTWFGFVLIILTWCFHLIRSLKPTSVIYIIIKFRCYCLE